MKITTVSQKLAGSCNFCKRGSLNEAGTGLHYPYVNVIQIESDGTGASVRLCGRCFNTVKNYKVPTP